MSQPGLWAPLICEPAMRAGLAWLESRAAPGWRVLDAGCGQGQLAGGLDQAGIACVGVDLEMSSLRRARRAYAGTALAGADITALPFDDAAFDALFVFSVFQYLARDRALSECARVLKPGGHLVSVENLAGNPVARTVRALDRLQPGRARPVGHLAWRERRIYERYFSAVEYRTFHVIMPALAALPAIQREREPDRLDLGHHGLYAAARRIDRWLLSLPGTGRWAWHGLICAVK